MEKFKLEAISFAQTFVTVFLIDIGIALSQIPVSEIVSGKVFTVAFLTSVLFAASRSALKVAWEKIMPLKLGGKKK